MLTWINPPRGSVPGQATSAPCFPFETEGSQFRMLGGTGRMQNRPVIRNGSGLVHKHGYFCREKTGNSVPCHFATTRSRTAWNCLELYEREPSMGGSSAVRHRQRGSSSAQCHAVCVTMSLIDWASLTGLSPDSIR